MTLSRPERPPDPAAKLKLNKIKRQTPSRATPIPAFIPLTLSREGRVLALWGDNVFRVILRKAHSVERNCGLPAGDQIRGDPRRTMTHGPSHVTKAGIVPQVLNSSAAE